MSTESIDPARYSFRVSWSESEQSFLGTCLELPGLTSEGETPEEALRDLRTLVTDRVDDCVANGEAVPEPLSTRSYSGTLTLRIGEELHRKLAAEAAEEGTSLDQHAIRKLSDNA